MLQLYLCSNTKVYSQFTLLCIDLLPSSTVSALAVKTAYQALATNLAQHHAHVGDTPLHQATWNGHLECVRLLLGAGTNLEARTGNGSTAAHLAAWQGHVELLRLLLDAGAAVDAVKGDLDTPLHQAAWQGHADCCRALLAAGAGRTLGMRDQDGERRELHAGMLKGMCCLDAWHASQLSLLVWIWFAVHLKQCCAAATLLWV